MKRPNRKKKTHLGFVGLQPKTVRAYRLALDNFLRFLGRRSIHHMRPSRLDFYVSEFINSAYQEGDPLAYSGHLLSALKRFHPELRLQLPVSSQFYRNWARNHVPTRAIPASWPLVEAMIAVAYHQKQTAAGLLLGLGFNCMLRTSEMLQLTWKHIVVHPSRAALSVILPKAKTSIGNPQVLQVTDLQLIAMASSHLDALRSRDKQLLIWPKSAAAFRDLFQDLLVHLGFGPQSYLPYSLRRGGSTWLFQHSLSLDLVVTRGRWACSKTARQYIDQGTLQLAQVTWTPHQCRQVEHWRKVGLRLRQQKKKRVR